MMGKLPSLSDGSTPCVDCKKPADVYDHRDYGKPIDVVPVCKSCNRKRGEALGWKPEHKLVIRITHDQWRKLRLYVTNKTLELGTRVTAQKVISDFVDSL